MADDAIPALLARQTEAIRAGDLAAIEATSRSLNAYALGEFAKLRVLQGNDQEAAALYGQSVAAEDSPEVRLAFLSALLRLGDGVRAEKESLSLVQVQPNSALAWAIRGVALHLVHQETPAVEALGRSLQIQPDPGVAFALGCSLLASEKSVEAERIFQSLLHATGNGAAWNVAMGAAYREAGKLQEALRFFQQALALNPKTPHAEFFLGYATLQLRGWSPDPSSLQHLRTAANQAPHDYASNLVLGILESADGGDLLASNHHLQAAAKADPGQAEAWLYLGLNAHRGHEDTLAKTDLEKALTLANGDETRSSYQIRRADLALGQILISEGDRARGEEMLSKYKQAEQAAMADASGSGMSGQSVVEAVRSVPAPRIPVPAPTATALGFSAESDVAMTEAQRRKLDATEAELRRVLASSYNDLGTAEARQQQYQAALGNFLNAERWHEPEPALLRNIGIAAFRTQDFAEAARALGTYLQHAQDDHLRLMLAMSQFSMGHFPDAAANFGQASAQTLQDPRAAYSWAFSLARTGQQQRANEIAGQLTTLALPPDAMNLVCHVYMDTEAYEQSLACLRKVAVADPTLRLVHYAEGESLIRLDRPAEAIPELRAELALSPGDPNVESSLAFALLQTSRKEEAKTLLEHAVETDPNHARAQYQLGKLLLDGGDVAAALPHLEVSEQSDPSPDYVHYQLGTAYRKLGRTADAERELKSYREIKDKARAAATVPQAAAAH